MFSVLLRTFTLNTYLHPSDIFYCFLKVYFLVELCRPLREKISEVYPRFEVILVHDVTECDGVLSRAVLPSLAHAPSHLLTGLV